jgi:hypothetical protein
VDSQDNRDEILTHVAVPESIHGSQYREMEDLSDTETVRGGQKMPGEWEARVGVVIANGLPKMDRAEFIEEWREHPLVPTLTEDDPRRPKVGRVDLVAQRRAERRAVEEAHDGRSEWSAVTEWEEAEVHGQFMKMRPGENEPLSSPLLGPWLPAACVRACLLAC